MDSHNQSSAGRPRLDDSSIRDKLISIRLSSSELAQLARVVPPNKTLSSWMRTMLLRMANDNEERDR